MRRLKFVRTCYRCVLKQENFLLFSSFDMPPPPVELGVEVDRRSTESSTIAGSTLADALPDAHSDSAAKSTKADKAVEPSNHPEDPFTAGMTFLIDDWLEATKTSGIILSAVMMTWVCCWLLGNKFGLGASLLIVVALSQVWQRQMRVYQLRVKCEQSRLQSIEWASPVHTAKV